MKRPTVPFLAPKYSFVDFEALLGRFAKYTLTANGFFQLHGDGGNGATVSFDCSSLCFTPPFITFRFVDADLLPESETHFFLLPFPKDLTSADETIVFGV